MALIGDIRKRSGLLVIIIGIALAAFVLGDLLSNRNPRQGVNTVGKINGEPIPITDFNQSVDENMEARLMNSGKEALTADEQFQVRQSTWDQMVNETLLAEQVDKLGITVTTQELDDQIRGKNPHPYIEQSFRDPESGNFDPAMVINFLQNLDNVDPQMKQRYLLIEKAIKEDRLNTKYRTLIAKGFYTPKAFAQRDYEARNTKAAIRYYGLPYTSIADSLITVSDKDLKAYYEENKFRYQQEASRDLEYVAFNIIASPQDRDKINREVQELYKEFQETTQIPYFVNSTSDERYDSTWYKSGTLPYQLDSVMFNSPVGTTFGPYIENNMYQMARLVDVQSRPDSLRASHILISYQGTNVNPDTKLNKAQAEAKADSVLEVVRNNAAKFDELAASDLNDDKTAAQSKGDLNWFADGAMVPVFNNAVLNGRVGDIVKVESQFGFHIIKITGKTAPINKVRVAIIKRGIEASSQTNQNIYTEASQFATEAKEADFDKIVEEKGYTKRLAERISKDQNNLPGLNQAREVVRWAFDEKRKVGDISPVYEIDGRYIVAKLTEKREKGIPTLEQVKEFIEPLAKRDKKAEKMIAEINKEITSPANLDNGYRVLGMKADTAEIMFASSNLPGYGKEDELIGTVFAMEAGELSKPIKGNQAVFVVAVDAINTAPAKDDFTNEKQMMNNAFRSRTQRESIEALKRLSKIEDNRLMFY
ncbi:MAG: SurA N-terminal domain-containing protein [Lentimicrobium sp.]|jgi:peptidyl-prolyl cis-trans isomerase D|nr:SurA N-terminal domain-containing protein [Lentimicrobium sp.]MDD2528637.1 SurA N-terminal domain-containing protein [Lentimicrobiaceae bacterium]MDD4597754.1 SurA N-terminal domain-containing protein [Lentimicrobiaceae bacterium]